jgi:hypothetical protein
MPKGPRGEKRPSDVIGAAVKVMKIATGEIAEDIGSYGDSALNRYLRADLRCQRARGS